MGMGCCGLTLYGSTVIAGILTLLDCVLYLTFDVFLIVFLSVDFAKNNSDFEQFLTDLHRPFVDDSKKTTIIILIGIKVGLRIVWFISGILLLVGNSREYRKFINVWKYLTISRIVYTIATSIYGLITIVSEDAIKELFDGKHNLQGGAQLAILLDLLELGPIWLIILIALAIYVHQRGQEIETKKGQNPLWTNSANFSQNYSNGSTRNGTSQLAHPVSLTAEPNPFTISAEHNTPMTNVDQQNNNHIVEPNMQLNHIHKPSSSPQPSSPVSATAPSPPTGIKPILEINGVISIPRVTLTPSKQPVPSKFDSHHDNKRYVSSLAKRSSHFEIERDPKNVPKRNHSYNLAQTGRPFSYENKAFDSKTETDIYKPVLIKRASTRRSHNQ